MLGQRLEQEQRDKEEKIELKEVYHDLTCTPLVTTPKIRRLFQKFAYLLSLKSSFSSRVHTVFKKLYKHI